MDAFIFRSLNLTVVFLSVLCCIDFISWRKWRLHDDEFIAVVSPGEAIALLAAESPSIRTRLKPPRNAQAM